MFEKARQELRNAKEDRATYKAYGKRLKEEGVYCGPCDCDPCHPLGIRSDVPKPKSRLYGRKK